MFTSMFSFLLLLLGSAWDFPFRDLDRDGNDDEQYRAVFEQFDKVGLLNSGFACIIGLSMVCETFNSRMEMVNLLGTNSLQGV
jgi:hypothetical protein